MDPTTHTALDRSLEARHARLGALLDQARSAPHNEVGTRDRVRETDAFLAATSRHLAAMAAVLLPQARKHLADGHDRARELITTTRRLEVSMNLAKARLYGASYAVHHNWPEVWDQVAEPFQQTLELETQLIRDLDAVLSTTDDEELADRLHESARHAPTRPHPFLPHQGPMGAVARRVAAKVDSFWDTAEGRMFPEPPKPPHRSHSLLEQYLLGEPEFEEKEFVEAEEPQR